MQIDMSTHQLDERFYLFYIGNKYKAIKCAMINHTWFDVSELTDE